MNCLGLLLLGMCLRGTASDPWKILDPARQVDNLCGSCLQGHVECSAISVIQRCSSIHAESGDHTKLPVPAKGLTVTFPETGGMMIEWNAGQANLDNLKGFYLTVWDLDTDRKKCRLFDLRNVGLTLEVINKDIFQYGCFPDGFVISNHQYHIKVQTIPVGSADAWIQVTSPRALTSPRPSVSPPGPRVSNWRPSHVDITAVTEGGGGALKVTFDAAPDNLSIPGYEVGLQNATNNTIGSPLYVQDPKTDSGMITVVLPILCTESSPVPAWITIEASAGEEEPCIPDCIPNIDFAVVSPPCRFHCPAAYTPNTVKHSDVCIEKLTAEIPSRGEIAGIVIGAFLFCAILALTWTCVYFYKLKPHNREAVLVCGGAYYTHQQLLRHLQEYLSPYLHNVTIQKQDGLPKKKNAVLLLVPPVDDQWRNDEDFEELKKKYHRVVLQLECCKAVQDEIQFSIPDDLKKLVAYVHGLPRCLPHVPSIKPQSAKHWPQLQHEIKRCCNLQSVRSEKPPPDVEQRVEPPPDMETGYSTFHNSATGCSVSRVNVGILNYGDNQPGDNVTLATHDC